MRRLLPCLLLIGPSLGAQVTLDAAQAHAALALLAAAGSPDSLWARHAATRGYQRLHERESAMGRPFTDSAFRAWLAADSVRARRAALARALAAWERGDFAQAAARARAYLPPGTSLRATVYVTIKPRPNSFVHDLATDPAVFFHLDPAWTPAKFTNVAAHELHHVGYAAACADHARSADAGHPLVRRWLSAFGEGWAMLAAAGGPDVHPHADSPPAERAEWDRALAAAPGDVERLAAFFTALLAGRLADADATTRGMGFFAERPQGPWYTVGWLMASTVERADGRAALLRMLCDPGALIRRYDALAGPAGLPRWPAELIARLP